MAVANTLTHYEMATTKAVKSFIVQTKGANVINITVVIFKDAYSNGGLLALSVNIRQRCK